MISKSFNGEVLSLGRVGVLYGGTSSEREISLQSGAAVLGALLAAGVDAIGIDIGENPVSQIQEAKLDRVFIVLHGPGGEDGKMQAMLELMNLPFTGSRYLASAIAMDKLLTKQICEDEGLPTPAYLPLKSDTLWEDLAQTLGEEVFVKPVHEGSSLGMSLVKNKEQYVEALDKALSLDKAVMAEGRIKGREFTVALLNGHALPAIELKINSEFYDYEAKYFSDDTQYLCPAPLSGEKSQELAGLAAKAFKTVGCDTWGRVDFMQDEQGNFKLLEINTVPGMTNHSLVPMAAKAAGLSFQDLVLEIAALAK